MSPSPTTSDKATKPKRGAKAKPPLDLTGRDEVLPLDAVIPYWRNPRRIPDEAVNAVAESIRRYGYAQPIVVDAAHTIVIGHTRYAALRRLGVSEVVVKVVDNLSSDQVRELRVMDNRTAEYTSWDFDSLRDELSDLDASLMVAYFPEAEEILDTGAGDVTAADPEPDLSGWDEVDRSAEFVCPSCFHTWTMLVDTGAVKTGRLEVTDAAS